VNWDAHSLITNTVLPSFTDTLDLSSLNFTANFIADASGVHAAQNEHLRVYPNPTNGLLHIAFEAALPTNSKIDIFSADGRLVKQQQVLSGGYQFTIDCSSLPAGVYYLAFSNDALNSRLRFVKK
ncbi:MAG: T9SS type A sorting domain-containing protein, partial [Bacteroidia bacterium]